MLDLHSFPNSAAWGLENSLSHALSGPFFDSLMSGAEVIRDAAPDVRQQAAYYGSLIRTRFGEPFFTFETMRVDDIAALEVSTF